jgi:hypothetical protein
VTAAESYAALSRLILASVREHRILAAPSEAVGLVWADGITMPLVNESPTPREAFLVSRQQIIDALRFRPPPVALYHTHANQAAPSIADSQMLAQLADLNASEPVMFIYGSDGLRAWTWHNGAVEEVDLGEGTA